MALVTTADLKTHMDIEFSPVQELSAESILVSLQDELVAYLGRPVEPEAFTEFHVVSPHAVGVTGWSMFSNSAPYSNTLGQDYGSDITIYFNQTPVTAITTVARTPRGGTQTALTEGTDFVMMKYGITLAGASTYDRIDVAYTAGLDGANISTLKGNILRAATRETQNLHDDTVGVKDLTTRNVAPLDTGFSDRELASMRRYRRVRVA